jgi:hypothetical protein
MQVFHVDGTQLALHCQTIIGPLNASQYHLQSAIPRNLYKSIAAPVYMQSKGEK